MVLLLYQLNLFKDECVLISELGELFGLFFNEKSIFFFLSLPLGLLECKILLDPGMGLKLLSEGVIDDLSLVEFHLCVFELLCYFD